MNNIEHRTMALFRHFPQLNAQSKRAIVRIWPAVAVIIGVLQLVAAGALWRLLNAVTSLATLQDTVASYYHGQLDGPTPLNRTMIYIGLAALIISAVLLFIAVSLLNKRRRSGWRLVVIASLVNVIYAVAQIFITSRGVGSCLFSALESLVLLYFLFQVYDKYHAGHKARFH